MAYGESNGHVTDDYVILKGQGICYNYRARQKSNPLGKITYL